MAQNLDGVFEKLKRTNENIRNLETEIRVFFQGCEYPVLPEDNKEILLKAIEYHKQLSIPRRFSVLTGEIVHHLRSCFDHLVWEFSSAAYRRDHERAIEFPVVEVRPSDKDSLARYERKIKGVTDAKIRALIERLQPYNSPDPAENPILILHKMDVIDKHRELILCAGTGCREFPMNTPIAQFLMANQGQVLRDADAAAALAHKLKDYGKLVPQIAFKEFGRRPIQPVVPGLAELNNYFVNVMKQFCP